MTNSMTTKQKAIALLQALSTEGRQFVRKDSRNTVLDPELTASAKTARQTDLDDRQTKIFKLINTMQTLLGTSESGTFTEDELEAFDIYIEDVP